MDEAPPTTEVSTSHPLVKKVLAGGTLVLFAFIVVGAILIGRITDSDWWPAYTLPSEYSLGYWMDGNSIIYCGTEVVPTTDVKTFRASGQGIYAKDKNHVYICNLAIGILEGADPASFTVLSKNTEALGSIYTNDFPYAKDKNYVYFSGEIMADADPSTFELLSSEYSLFAYAKDKNRVYYFGKALTSADLSTFTIISSSGEYAKDKDNVYYSGDIVADADPDTFEIILSKNGEETLYAKDASRVFRVPYGEVPGADPDTFEVLADSQASFAKDKNNIYRSTYVLRGVDHSTFVLLKGPYDVLPAKDKNHVYLIDSGQGTTKIISEADPATFVFINMDGGGYYYKDAKHVYVSHVCDEASYNCGLEESSLASRSLLEVVPGADPATFIPPTRDY